MRLAAPARGLPTLADRLRLLRFLAAPWPGCTTSCAPAPGPPPGANPQPTAAVTDSQSVRAADTVRRPARSRGRRLSFSEHEVTIVALMSTVTSSRSPLPGTASSAVPGPFPGGGPGGADRLQCPRRIRCQHADQSGHDRVRGHRPDQGRRRAAPRYGQAVPPSASVTARSAMTFPGSCTARSAFHQPSAAARPAPQRPGQQHPASLGHDPRPVSGHGDLRRRDSHASQEAGYAGPSERCRPLGRRVRAQ